MSIVELRMIRLVAALAFSAPLSGCGFVGLVDTRGMMDMETGPVGNHLVSDTPRNWELSKTIIDIEIDRESKGIAAPRAFGGTWRGYWKAQIQAKQKYRANPERYIDYIVTARRARGLPEL